MSSDRTFEDLKQQVREMPLDQRLQRARDMIGKMCKEKRPPRMSIPLQHYDEDFFISTTLDDARAARSLPNDQAGVVRLLELIYASMSTEPGRSGGPDELLRWVREWAIEKMGGGEDEGWAWLRRKLTSAFPEGIFKARTDNHTGTKYELMGWMHVLCYRAQAEKLYVSIAVEQQKLAEEAEARLQRARSLIADWANRQGQGRCWYFPDIFNALAEALGVSVPQAQLPPREEFEAGCERYQYEQYPEGAPPPNWCEQGSHNVCSGIGCECSCHGGVQDSEMVAR
jgi:hypothetical protein